MKRRKAPTPPKPTPRTIKGIPGTVEPGFRERPIEPLQLSPTMLAQIQSVTGLDHATMRSFRMGHCNILLDQEPAGPGGKLLWHLTISTPSRHPTWDEIKVARYRLLPHELTFAMLLPPPGEYVNVPAQDHVFQLWETPDPRTPGPGR
jgi:hypothetical protein